MVAKEWLGAFWVQLVGSCSWTVILITRGSEPLTCVVGVVIITWTMKNLQKTRSHTYGKRKEYKMVDLRTKKGKRRCSLKIVEKEKLETVLFLVLQVVSQSVQSLSHVAAPTTEAHQASTSTSNSWSLLKLMYVKLVMPSNHLVLCHLLLLLPSIFPSIRVFSNESVVHITWPKNWSFSFSISLFNEYSGLISFRMVQCDLFAVQGILKSLLQHHRSKSSILQCSAFFIVQLSHPYMTTGKTIALTRRAFVGNVVSLIFKCCLGWS